jgi:hypothetical protein
MNVFSMEADTIKNLTITQEAAVCASFLFTRKNIAGAKMLTHNWNNHAISQLTEATKVGKYDVPAYKC